jgi:hypothetical protein
MLPRFRFLRLRSKQFLSVAESPSFQVTRAGRIKGERFEHTTSSSSSSILQLTSKFSVFLWMIGVPDAVFGSTARTNYRDHDKESA